MHTIHGRLLPSPPTHNSFGPLEGFIGAPHKQQEGDSPQESQEAPLQQSHPNTRAQIHFHCTHGACHAPSVESARKECGMRAGIGQKGNFPSSRKRCSLGVCQLSLDRPGTGSQSACMEEEEKVIWGPTKKFRL